MLLICFTWPSVTGLVPSTLGFPTFKKGAPYPPEVPVSRNFVEESWVKQWRRETPLPRVNPLLPKGTLSDVN